MSRARHRSRVAVVAACALVAVTTACSGSSASSAELATGDASSAELADVRIAQILGPAGAALWAAQEAGVAEGHGISIEPVWVDNSQVALTSVVSGEVQAAAGSYFGTIDAINQGLPIAVVAEEYASAPGTGSLEALRDSGISSVADLPGRTVNVLSLNSSHAIKLKSELIELGLDPDSVDWVELPYGEVAAALEQGTVDASSAVGPALAIAKSELDTVTVFDYGEEPFTGMGEAGYFMATDFIAAHPNTTAAIQCSLAGGAQALIDDRALFERFLVDVVGMGAEAAAAEAMPDFQTETRVDAIQENADLYRTTGYIDTEFDFSQHIVPSPEGC
jgi:NitT/TauT family transport system substrate-binding protein